MCSGSRAGPGCMLRRCIVVVALVVSWCGRIERSVLALLAGSSRSITTLGVRHWTRCTKREGLKMVAWELVSENNDTKEETDKSQEAEELFA